MIQLDARLAKIFLRQAPAFFLRALCAGTEIESRKQCRWDRFTSTAILYRIAVDFPAPRAELCRGMRHGKPAVAESGDAPQGIFVFAGGQPNWQWVLNRLGLDADFVEAIVFSFK